MPDENSITPKRGRGRPGTYTSAAERARAWRQRQRDLIAQAQQPAEPVVVEKVVEKIIEKRVEVPVVRGGSSRTDKRPPPEARKLFQLLKTEFGTYGGEDKAKRLRVNAAKAASTAREILGMLQYKLEVPENEKAFLQDAAQFFEAMNGLFETAQGQAKRDKAKADAEFLAKREVQLAELIQATFGDRLNHDEVVRTATELQQFASREVCDAEAKRRGVDRSFFFISREFELRGALKAGDTKKIAREVAEVRLEVGERGRAWKDRDEESCYSAGWADFIRYRTNDN